MENTVAKNVNIEGIVKVVAKCCSKDKKQHNLQNVYIQVDGENWTATATDGYRMEILGNVMPHGVKGYIVPVKALRELRKSGVKACDIVFFGDSRRIGFFVGTDMVMESESVEGIYPHYDMCIPNYFEYSVKFQAGELMDALKRVEDFVYGQNHRVALSFDSWKGVARVENTNPVDDDEYVSEDLKQVREEFTCTSGYDSSIGFNLDFLKGILSRFGRRDWVNMKLNNSVGATIFTLLDGQDRFTSLLMPVRL